jgi:hypothetical protein
MTTISNQNETINSTDVIERIDELGRVDRDALEAEEYESLTTLAEQCEGYGDWQYGETLIRASYFTDYVRELLADTGAVPTDLPWYIRDAIDWDEVARHIDQDYIDVVFDGVTYKMRA